MTFLLLFTTINLSINIHQEPHKTINNLSPKLLWLLRTKAVLQKINYPTQRKFQNHINVKKET